MGQSGEGRGEREGRIGLGIGIGSRRTTAKEGL